MRRKFMAFAALMTLAAGHQAVAASLCVRQTGIPAQCLYDDPAECQREAKRLGGECVVNPVTPIQLTGSAQFCTVNGSTGFCLYPDRPSCNAEAARTQSACVPNIPEATPPEDLFRQFRNY